MADEEKEEKEGEEGKKKSKLIIFVVAGVVALLLIVGIVIAVVMLTSTPPPPPPEGEEESAPKRAVNTSALQVGPIYQLDQFIVNLLTQSGRRYLKTSVNLELSHDKLFAEIETKEAVITDTIIGILSSKSIEEISTIKGKDRLKQEISERINEFLVDGEIVGVYFTQFVVQ